MPLRPMLGSIGVAPLRKVSRAGQQGNQYGGNMDDNRIREGATLHLPVNVPGAQLLLGNGHAAQGDGELTGSALETSMDVEFAVELIRDKRLRGPRAEDAEYVMAWAFRGLRQKRLHTQPSRWRCGCRTSTGSARPRPHW